MAPVPDLDFHKRHRDPQEIGVQHGDHLARTPPVRSGVFNQLGEHAPLYDIVTLSFGFATFRIYPRG